MCPKLIMDGSPEREREQGRGRERERGNTVSRVVKCKPWKYNKKLDLTIILFHRSVTS